MMGVIEADLIITGPPPSVLGIKECAGQRGMSTYGSAGSSPKEVGACIDDIILQSP